MTKSMNETDLKERVQKLEKSNRLLGRLLALLGALTFFLLFLVIMKLPDLDSSYLNAIGTWMMNLVLLFTLCVLAYQSITTRRAFEAQAYTLLFDRLQSDEVRKARQRVMEHLRKKDRKDWTEDDVWQAEKVCSTFDGVATMVHGKLIKKEMLAVWKDSMTSCWDVLKPLVYEYREKRGDDYWENFELLVKEINRSR